MKLITIFALTLTIYGIAALPQAEDAVVPEEEELVQFVSEGATFEETKQMLLDMKSAGKNDKDCRKLADATENDVKKNVQVEQGTLEKMEKGKECESRGVKAVQNAADALKKAKAKAKSTATVYKKTQDDKVDFGKHAFGSLTEGNCAVFYQSSAYRNAKAAAKAAKSEKLKAEGALDVAKKIHTKAIADQIAAENDCYCDLKALHAKTLVDLNKKSETANKAAWTQAAHIRCVLDGTPMAQCKVTALPKVKKVSLTKKAEAAGCSTNTGTAMTTKCGTVRCGGQTKGKPVGHVKNPVGPTYQKCDPFAVFSKACAKKFGSGAHMCTRKELDATTASQRKKTGIGGHLITACGKYSSTYTGKGGWLYTCRQVSSNGNWAVNQWAEMCNGQAAPCCK